MSTKNNVTRIDNKSLKMILDGKITSNHSVIIKMYAPHCQYCHNLTSYYKDLSNEYENVQFMAFNMDDGDENMDFLEFQPFSTLKPTVKERKSP
mgnify:CR=1 FL=1